MYLELHAASAFSFLEGASTPEELAQVCAAWNMPAMALMDRDGLYGSPRFHMAMKKAGLRAHIGSEITVEKYRVIGPSGHRVIKDQPDVKTQSPDHPITRSPDLLNRETRLPLLVSSRSGYQNLCRLITRMKMRGPKDAPPEVIAAREEDLAEFAPGLICLTGGEEGPLAAALARGGREEARRVLDRLAAIFGRDNLYVELQRHYLRDQEARNQALVALAAELGLPLLATNGVRYAAAPERQVLDVFTCLHHHRTLDTAGRLLARNSERHLKPPAEMARLFADLPQAIANTSELSARLQFQLCDLGYEFPRYPVPPGETMMSFLRWQVAAGFRERYGRAEPGLRSRAHRQIERELALIGKLQLEGYFLIVWDIVRFCRQQGILAQGRGSAANSAVCYSLGITAVDPIRMDLLFERFLSEERGEWPDIDIDLPSGEQRERVIQHVYQRYGERGAAMTANVITYRGRLAAREVGKVMGFDTPTLNRLSAVVGAWEYHDSADTMERRFADAGFDLRHPRIRRYCNLCLAVQDLPRHLGQHSGGMVICQGQLDSVVPLEPASMPGRVVVQWDKEDCADLGIIKVDLLGLGMMAVLEDSIQLIRDHYQEEVDLAQLPAGDPAVYSALQKADTVGMFQIESRAQMSCLPRLRPERFYDIVVQVAIIRPGPIVGKMVHPYLKRRQGREPVAYPHPALEPVLARTLGIPLFQEQLLRMAMVVAGFSGGEAEELRRALGFKRSEKRMREIELKLRAGMARNGITGEAQEQIVQSITAFALYGFPESHSASFALLAYASAFLKVHYLAAFTAALLNNQPMGFYHPSTIVKDAQRHGLKVRPVDVTKSDWPCTLEKEGVASDQWSVVSEEVSSFQFPVASFQKKETPASDWELRTENWELPAAHWPLPTGHCPLVAQTGNWKPETGNSFSLRLGLRYVKGLREDAARALVRARACRPFASIDDLVRRVPELRKNELETLAEIGALNKVSAQNREIGSSGHRPIEDKLETPPSDLPITRSPDHQIPRSPDPAMARSHRRSALWLLARAVNRPGEILEEADAAPPDAPSPLAPMHAEERLVADFRGTGLTVGPHPLAYHRARLQSRGIRAAQELPNLPNGRRVRVAGCVIARQRPGTASGFVFLSLEDETGIANAIVTPDLFDRHRGLLVAEKFLLVEGVLQNQDHVVSVKADRVLPLRLTAAPTTSHDFH